jgi:hypothetical protein
MLAKETADKACVVKIYTLSNRTALPGFQNRHFVYDALSDCVPALIALVEARINSALHQVDSPTPVK